MARAQEYTHSLIAEKIPRYKRKASNKDELDRINHLSNISRQHWLVLITFLGFITVTLFGVEDINFFVLSQKTELPLIGVSIPATYFFYFAPILAAILHCYLHVHLMKLWNVMTIKWHNSSGNLGDKMPSWLVSDLVLWARTDIHKEPIPLQTLINSSSILMVFWSTPLILLFFWWRSMPAHDLMMTLSIAICAFACIVFSSKSRRLLKSVVSKKKLFIPSTKSSLSLKSHYYLSS